MSAITRKRWTKNEDEILSSSLVNGIELQELYELLPTRSPDAIIRRCLNLGFSTHSKNGVKVLFYGIKRRKRVAKLKTSEAKKKNDEVAADVTITTRHSDTPATVESFTKKHAEMIQHLTLTKPNIGLEINNQAISILQDYKLQTDSNSIFELSEFIAKNQMKDIS